MNRYCLTLSVSLAILAILHSSPGLAAAQSGSRSVAEDNAAFGWDLYQKLRETEGNLFFSPYSISTALAMTYAGARGQTQEEMASVLHFSPQQAALHREFAALQSHMKDIQEKGHVRLSIANSLWCQQGCPFLDSFLDPMKRHYGAGLSLVDFGQTEDARQAINAWVEKETQQKIKELLLPGNIDASTTLVLCNAIYFKGDWGRQFDKKATKDADFFIARDKTVKVPMMGQESEFRWKDFGNFSAIELPYKGNEASMVVLLPEAIDGLAELEKALTQSNLTKSVRELTQSKPSKVVVGLPRFKATCRFELQKVLGEMGMPSAFGDADFSGMTGKRDLSISKVIHKAFVEVNEEGTEAAAATAVVVGRPSPAVPVFWANHPFVFLIREKQTGSILFVGRVADPTSSGGSPSSGPGPGAKAKKERLINVQARAEGEKEAEQDIAKGRLGLRLWGMLRPSSGEYRRLLEEKCGVKVVVVAGDAIAADHVITVEKAHGYNRRMEAEIKRRFGKDIFEHLLKEAEKQYLDRLSPKGKR